MLKPVFEDVAKEFKEYNFYKVNIDEVSLIAQKYQVMSIPTFFIFEDGKLLQARSGGGTKELFVDWIKKSLTQNRPED